MGFLQLVPADSLTATYKTKTHKLSLNAKGNALTFTSSVSFQRMPWEGGLLFDLQGWVGPRAIGTTPYDITDYFDIELPNVVTPSNTIIVKTADGNKTIDIVYEPPLPRGAASNGGSNGASDKTVQVPETKDGGATDRTVLYKMPFDIVSLSERIYLYNELCESRWHLGQHESLCHQTLRQLILQHQS